VDVPPRGVGHGVSVGGCRVCYAWSWTKITIVCLFLLTIMMFYRIYVQHIFIQVANTYVEIRINMTDLLIERPF